MPLLLDLGTALYHAGIKLAAPFVPKARAWVEGRRGLWARLEAKAEALQGCVWIHCASVGEFEQARPVLETLQRERPGLPVLITFFSPSGYEARKDLSSVTHVEYLPADGAYHAERLLALVKPRLAVFIKYEFWYHHLSALHRAQVPTFIVSAIFRPSQPFFKWYGGAHRRMLRFFDHLFVQNEASRALLASIGIHNVTVSGDTRFDRVAAITRQNEELPIARSFRRASDLPILVAGSTWPADEAIIQDALRVLPGSRAIMVPHELTAAHLNALEAGSPVPIAFWSQGDPAPDTSTLIVDRMGYLSRLYKYADVTYVGGGFGSGIHNTLEAAAWGRPVIFGPNHARFAEAHGLIAAGAGFPVKNTAELRALLERFYTAPEVLRSASDAAARYVRENEGATAIVSKALLTKL